MKRPELAFKVAALGDALRAVPEARLAPRNWLLGPHRGDAVRVQRFNELNQVLDALLDAVRGNRPLEVLDGALDRIGVELADLCVASTPWTWYADPAAELRFTLLGSDGIGPGLTVELVAYSATTPEQEALQRAVNDLLGVLLGATRLEDRN